MEKISNTINNNDNNKDIYLFIESLNEHKFFGIIVNKLNNISSEKIKSRIIEIIKILNSSNIDFIKLKKIIFDGLPDDCPSLRSLNWKMILNYLPLNLDEWENYIDTKRNEYNEIKNRIITKLELDKLKYEKNKNRTNVNSVEILDSGIIFIKFKFYKISFY